MGQASKVALCQGKAQSRPLWYPGWCLGGRLGGQQEGVGPRGGEGHREERVSPMLEHLSVPPLCLPPRKTSKPRENDSSEQPLMAERERKGGRIACGTKHQDI